MTKFPKISIVTPSYNQVEYIEKTILSVLNQNYPNLEYIIIDGGSDDGSVDIIKKYEDKITYWVSEKDEGQYYAIQKGFEKSTGEIMTFINSDDLLSKGCLLSISQIFTEYSQVNWLGGAQSCIDEIGRNIQTSDDVKWNKYRYVGLDFKYIQQEGTFWRRDLWVKSGSFISTHYKLASDLELWSRFFCHAEIYHITGTLGNFRVRSKDQRSFENLNEYNNEAMEILLSMPQEKNDRKQIRITKSLIYRILNRQKLSFIFKLLGFKKIKNKIEKFPDGFYFDRIKQKYVLFKRS